MYYIFANVGRGNLFRQRKAFAVSKSVNKTSGRRGFVEIGESDGRINEPLLMKLMFPRRKWAVSAVETHTPVVYPASNPVKIHKEFSAKGKSGVFPNKWWVTAEFTDDKVVLINGHMPPGAFNAKKDSHEQYRKDAWEQMWERLKNLIEEFLEAGYSVVVMTDANRQVSMPLPHDRAVVAERYKTDYIWAIAAAGKLVRVGRRGTKSMGIDFHRVLFADITFVR